MSPITIALDIETECALKCAEKCEHALDPHRANISIIGIYYLLDGVEVAKTFRDVASLELYLSNLGFDYALVGHNFKFDLKHMGVHGLDLADRWGDDTQLMAATSTEKISQEWLEWYAGERKKANALLPRGYSHREGSLHSLKSLAPAMLGVAPFWERPDNHDSVEYVLKDCEYTYKLWQLFTEKLKEQGSYEFYRERFLPWTKLLLKMERRGIALDLEGLERADAEARELSAKARARLDTLWADAHAAYYELEKSALEAEYAEKAKAAIARLNPLTTTPIRREKTLLRYKELCAKAVEKLPRGLNLDSPSQLAWLFKEHLQLDITTFHGEESTGKPVMKKHAAREDIATYLQYRQQQKLTQAFFPSYRSMNVDGSLHCTFNPTGARTGRLSSSGPNLQQVAGALHRLFIARNGSRLATYDMSAIEPRLIAYYTGDVNLYDIVASGQDFHGHTTKVLFEQDDWDVSRVKEEHAPERKMCKEVGLSLFYGAGAGRLQETSQKYGFPWSRKECQRKLERFKEFYEGVFKFRDEYVSPILTSGGTIVNLLGRPFVIPDPQDVHMQGFNTLIQGSASDLVLNSAARIQARFSERDIDGHVLLLVHDEIVTEIPAEREAECVELITDAMTNYELNSPLGPVKLMVEGAVSKVWQK